MAETQTFEQCSACGATIYPEHLASRKAERIGGKLFCVHCARDSSNGTENEVAVEILEDAPNPEPTMDRKKSAISFDRSQARKEIDYRRPLEIDSPTATRCRIFHCRITDPSMRNLEEQINEWIDSQENVRIKFSTSTVGNVDGKGNDPHLIVTLYY
ncbi:MAG: hypothetical protein AB7N71_03170 [Phycisphaerae bacterium]